MRFDAQLYFANASFFKEHVNALAATKGADLKTIILKFDSINNLDSSAAHMLDELVTNYKEKRVAILFTGVKGLVRDALDKSHLLEKFGTQHFFMSVQEAVDYVDKKKHGHRVFDNYTLQTNS